jgi:FkbH-like protein
MKARLEELKSAVAAGDVEQMRLAIRRILELGPSVAQLMRAARCCDAPGKPAGIETIRIALLGNHTLVSLIPFIRLHCLEAGVWPNFFVNDFGSMTQTVIEKTSGLYAYDPDYCVIFHDPRDVALRDGNGFSGETLDRQVATQVEELERLAALVLRRTRATLVESNFAIPDERWLGSLESQTPDSALQRLRLINLSMLHHGDERRRMLDLDFLSSRMGRTRWFDERLFHHSKHPFSIEAHTVVAQEFGQIIRALLGRSSKCLVLDLDGTLWGGTVGDDGYEGIRIGQGDGESEAYFAFGTYVRRLGERGVILTVCSKNSEEWVREAFERRARDIPLSLADFRRCVANWEPKPQNVLRIASELNLSIDSLVFFDNDPVERALMRDLLPGVRVVEVPEDPALYVRVLDREGHFDTAAVTREDLTRQASYQGRWSAEAERERFGDLETFLESLEMQVEIRPFCTADLPRIAQLVNKTNQFNLTTRRYSQEQIRDLKESPEHLTYAVRLSDRFADHGLVSVLIGRVVEDRMTIETWLMSCRVAARGLEARVFAHVLDEVRRLGIKEVAGEYRPTPKNCNVKDLLASLGFAQTGTTETSTQWSLPVEEVTGVGGATGL